MAVREVGPGQTFTTIQAAINVAVAGDVINIHAGTYTGNVNLVNSGTVVNKITMQNNAGDTVLMTSTVTPVINIIGRDYWTIKKNTTGSFTLRYTGTQSSPKCIENVNGAGRTFGLTVDGLVLNIAGGTASSGDGGAGISLSEASSFAINNNTINISATTGSHDGLRVIFGQTGTINNNEIFGNVGEATGKLEDGMVVTGTDIVIDNNYVHDGFSTGNHADGIVVQGDGPIAPSGSQPTQNITITRNRVTNFTQGIYIDCIHNSIIGNNLMANNIVWEQSNFRDTGQANKMNALDIDGEQLSGAAGFNVNFKVYNNIWDARQLLVRVNRTVPGNQIEFKNNLFVDCTFTEFFADAPNGVTMDYNYWTGNNVNETVIKWGTTNYTLAAFKVATGQETHSRTMVTNATLGVTDVNNFNYTPLVTSDNRNRGVDLSAFVSTDILGIPHAGNLPFDIGAYEFVPSGTDTTPPTDPSSLIANVVSQSRIDLSWTASFDIVGVTAYRIEQCQGVACTGFVQVQLVSGISTSVTGLTANTTYRFRVRATDAAGNLSGYSNIVSATTLAAPDTVPPTDPSSLVATVISGTQINLSWTGSFDTVGVTAYLIERCQGTACVGFAQITSTASTTFNNTGLLSSTVYRYRVRATDAAGNLSGYSNIVSATTLDVTSPTAPTNLVATALDATSINLTWTASTDNVGVTNYLIERCQGVLCSGFVQVNTSTSSPFTDTGLTASTIYRYQIRATDLAGNLGPYSSIAETTTLPSGTDVTPPPVPTGVSVI